MTAKELFQKKCIIGMVHLLPLPGTLNYTGEIDAIYSQAIADAKALEEGGASALIVENMNDVPAPLTLSAEQFAFLAAAAARVKDAVKIPVGIDAAFCDWKASLAIAKAVKAFDPSLILLGLSGSESVRAAQDIGLPAAREVFADRAYMPDGSLMPRTLEGAVIHDENEAIRRVVRMVKEHKVTASDGTDIEIVPDSICVHGDNIKALTFVTQIRSALEAEGIQIAPLSEII